MKWSWGKSDKTNENEEKTDTTMSKALVKQDPRTKVKTTSAQSETTNTTTQNATIFNNNAKTITFQTTKQTVTSRQTARVTEITTRRTPTPQELEEMMRLLAMNKKAETKTFTTTSTTSGVQLRRNRPNNLPALTSSSSSSYSPSRNSINSLNNKSTPKFKNTAASPVSRLIFNYESHHQSGSGSNIGDGPKTPTTPTLVKTQTTTVTEKNGRTITQRVEEHRIKLDAKSFKLSSPNSPLTRNYMGEDSFAARDAQPFKLPALPAPPSLSSSSYSNSKFGSSLNKPSSSSSSTSSYTSPYSNKQWSTTAAGVGKTTASSISNLSFGSTSKPSASTTTSLTFSTTSKPISSVTSRGASNPSSSSSSLFSASSNNKPGSLFSSWSGSGAATTKADAKPFPKSTTSTSISSPYTTSSFNTKPAVKSAPASSVAKKETGPRLKPGYAYIFNNVIFDNPNNEERIGSTEDVKALTQTFEFFKMKVSVIENAKVDKVKKTVEKIQSKDFTEYACIVIVILSHGNRHEEIAAKDGHYSIDDHVLFPILRNNTLNDKPKMFFIQACKGSMESKGYYTDATPFSPPGSANEILKCYSTFEGFVSYRTEKGSIFIQSLCKNLKLFGSTKNIKDIMETVTLLVKQQSMNKQIPAYTSTLTKPFVFGDYVKWAK
ncbi:death associated molecule related to Mch2 caspase [Musca autumnalis]|uniref:death associated molecule related to Mch2 caspase n=1 Tax=Musca autumnalis TaxID=221902 RepID=UPI003CF4B5C6